METTAQLGERINKSLFSFLTESLKADQETEKRKPQAIPRIFWSSPNADQKDEEKKNSNCSFQILNSVLHILAVRLLDAPLHKVER